jgi:hypothetical protein
LQFSKAAQINREFDFPGAAPNSKALHTELAPAVSANPILACQGRWKSAILQMRGGKPMAGNGKLKDAAVKIGAAAGKMDAKAHKAAKKAAIAIDVAKEELDELTKQVDALKHQLAKSSKRLQAALK